MTGCSEYDPAAHEAEVLEWREARLAELTAEDSWLTLVNYQVLWNNPMTMGSRQGMNIAVPRGPEMLGMFVNDGLTDSTAAEEAWWFYGSAPTTADGVEMTEPVPAISDSGAVRFRQDGLTWFVRRFQDQYAVRVIDNRASLRTDFPGLEYYPVNPEWRLYARYEPYDPPKRFPVAIYTGGDVLEESPGRVTFSVAGEEYALDVTDTSETGYFVIFSDETNNESTYPAGRYVWFDKPLGSAGPVILDFNKSYNPPCAFTEFATCPLPPRSHHIDARIEAGELRFRKPV